jgi:hypothetical protein
MAERCRLSVVVTSRNDDHGRDMLKRFSLFADGLLEQAARFGLTGELLVVEWNPAPGPRLHQVLHFKTKVDHFPVRFIEVPLELHQTLNNHDKLPLFQMIAKNVGIRRARGEFVLATNPDLLFTDELIQFLAQADLDPNAMYRLDRIDVAPDVPVDCSHEEQIAWCQDNVIRINARFGTFPRPTGRWAVAETALRLFFSSIRRRVSRVRVKLRKAGGWIGRFTSDVARSLVAHATGRSRHPWSETFRVGRQRMKEAFYTVGEGSTRLLALELRSIGQVLEHAAPLLSPRIKPHTNACGDFTLLSRDAWIRLRGYPELAMYSLHIDSFLCLSAVAVGYEEIELKAPMKMFHIEHGRSWVVMDVEEKLQMFAHKPWIDLGLLGEVSNVMNTTGEPIHFNGANWGFGDRRLPELTLGAPPQELPARA